MTRAFLVDTNIVSTGAPGRSEGGPALAEWMDAQSARLFISAVTIAELADGVAKLRREGATRKAAALEEWLRTLVHLYADRVLPVDVAVALEAGPFLDRVRGLGHSPGFPDAAIAATASVHGLTVLTRNRRHFAGFGVDVLDPFIALPP